MVGKCKYCRFWVRDSDGPVGDCSNPKFVDASDYQTETPIDGLSLWGDDGASFSTGAEFGCVHFEEKGNE
jgi:hypothetical protein